MTTTLDNFVGVNAVGAPSHIVVFQNAGEAIQWRILNPETGQVRYRSTMLGAPSYGYYLTKGSAMTSAKRVLATLAQ